MICKTIMAMFIRSLVYSILFTSFPLVDTNSFEDYKKLYNYLEEKIDIRIRPMLNKSDVLKVYMMPSLISVQGLDEKAQVLRSTLVLLLEWNYETLKWPPLMYGNTSIVHFSPNDIWLPDLAYQNSVGNTFELRRLKTMKVAISADGHAVWPNGGNIETSCHVDITKYPFDTQLCTILVGKVYSYDYEIMIIPKSNKIDVSAHTDNDEWILEDSNIRYRKIFEQMNFIELELVLQRRYLFYLLNTISPVILLSLLNVFSFKLPITSGERMSYCISLFLTFIVLLKMISDSMPEVSKNVSYLQLYVNIQLILGMITTTISIFLVRMTQEDENCFPKWIVTLQCILYTCNSKNKVKSESLEHLQIQEQGKHEETEEKEEISVKQDRVSESTGNIDNMKAVKFIDTLCFWCFLGLFCVSTSTCILLMTN